MAKITKARARKALAEGPTTAGVSNFHEGLRFNIGIGDLRVALTREERDSIVASWAKSEEEFR